MGSDTTANLTDVYIDLQSKPAKRGTSGPEVGRPVLAERPVLRESFVWGLNQFLDHAPRFEGCPVFRVPRYAGFDCNNIERQTKGNKA